MALAILGLAAWAAGQQPALPPSLQSGELESCAPTTLEAAESCLRTTLSPEDLATVEQRLLARQFRPNLDMAITTAWRLDDSNSPMGRVMDGLLGAHLPDVAAGMIISDLQGRATGLPLDFSEIARMIRANPIPQAPEGVPVTMTAPATENEK
jgi:hypothetical protein